ncbi:MAG: xylulokinase [bacterium]
MSNYVIGVDIGTGGTKAGLFNENGQPLALAFKKSTMTHPKPGWVNQKMDDFYKTAIAAIKEIMDKSNVNPEDVAALAFDGQMSGIGAIDNNWNPVMRYDNWLDTRCENQIKKMDSIAGEEIIKKTGAPPTYSHAPKILWWKKNHPDIFKKINKFIVPSVYVAGKLAGLEAKDAYLDYTYLHFTGFADNQNLKWDNNLCKTFDISKSKLPKIVSPGTIIGKISKKAAISCNLVEGIPIAAGAGDTTTSYLGAGIVEPGTIFDVAGTASVFASCTNNFAPDLKYKTVMSTRSVIKGLWNPISFINGGGKCLEWFKDEIAVKEKEEAKKTGSDIYSYLNKLAAEINPGSNNLIFVPHFGGRVLPPQPSLRGSWVGLSWGHKKETLYRSILESIAYEYYYYLKIKRNLYPETNFKEVRVLGGGAKSHLWNQIKSDVLNIPYQRIEANEPAVLGSAIIAGNSVGMFSDIKKTSIDFFNRKENFQPRKKYHEFYKKYAEIYIGLIDDLKSSYLNLDHLKEFKN